MRTFILSLAALAVAAPAALAQPAPLGCYARDYTEEHLAGRPSQGVAQMRLLLSPPQIGSGATARFEIRVIMSNQGQAERDGVTGQVLFEEGQCRDEDALDCTVACDGGGFEVVRQGNSELLIRTGAFMRVADGLCGEGKFSSSLAEEAGPQLYLLRPAPLESCREF
ncbi:MAG: hypothetical protein AAF914_02525 [Pseudomonadota bacterium]